MMQFPGVCMMKQLLQTMATNCEVGVGWWKRLESPQRLPLDAQVGIAQAVGVPPSSESEVSSEDAIVDDGCVYAICWIGGRHMRRSPWSLLVKATAPM